MMGSEAMRWRKKLQSSFNPNAKMWSRVQVVDVSVATCDVRISTYALLHETCKCIILLHIHVTCEGTKSCYFTSTQTTLSLL